MEHPPRQRQHPQSYVCPATRAAVNLWIWKHHNKTSHSKTASLLRNGSSKRGLLWNSKIKLTSNTKKTKTSLLPFLHHEWYHQLWSKWGPLRCWLRLLLVLNPPTSQLKPTEFAPGLDSLEHALVGRDIKKWKHWGVQSIIYLYIYGPASLGTSPPPTPWLWVCIVAPQYPHPPLWCGWCGWWWVVVVEEVVYVCIWMYMYGMNVYF